MPWLKSRIAEVRYRISGLPVSLTNLRRPRSDSPADQLRHIYARRYWSFRSVGEAAELGIALAALPFFLLGTALWHSFRSGPGHARHSRRPVVRQFADQIRLYAASGVMPASYYILSLYEQPTVERARSFLKRSETKGLLYHLVRERMRPRSSLANKSNFEARCRSHGLPVVPTVGTAEHGELPGVDALPPRDLFVKPLKGKGGRGAERWSHVGNGRFRSAQGAELSDSELRAHILRLSRKEALILQPRIANHPALEPLNAGALSTARVLTCLDEKGEPEVIGAALRMAVREDAVVDNLHGGGIAAAIDCATGELGPATNLGKDARIGWVDRHPVSGAQITGRKLDWWPQVKALALRAHEAFSDRLFVGWDIAMTEDGPLIVEANGSPDLDILQRCYRTGMAESRFAELLAYRLREPDRR